MVFLNYSTMQMVAKIVYYGPGLCGKTTNLKEIYKKTSSKSRGEMVSLETETDRTLFFDLLPMDVGVIGGFKTKFQLYTVPGQVFYNSTRKLVLRGVDGIVFVADSQIPMLDANLDSYENLKENLVELGLELADIPLVFQYNKRDLPNIHPVDKLNSILNDYDRPFIESSALKGIGVFETLKEISKQTLLKLRAKAIGGEQRKKEAVSLKVRGTDQAEKIKSDIEKAAAEASPVIEEEHTEVKEGVLQGVKADPVIDEDAIPKNVSFDTYEIENTGNDTNPDHDPPRIKPAVEDPDATDPSLGTAAAESHAASMNSQDIELDSFDLELPDDDLLSEDDELDLGALEDLKEQVNVDVPTGEIIVSELPGATPSELQFPDESESSLPLESEPGLDALPDAPQEEAASAPILDMQAAASGQAVPLPPPGALEAATTKSEELQFEESEIHFDEPVEDFEIKTESIPELEPEPAAPIVENPELVSQAPAAPDAAPKKPAVETPAAKEKLPAVEIAKDLEPNFRAEDTLPHEIVSVKTSPGKKNALSSTLRELESLKHIKPKTKTTRVAKGSASVDDLLTDLVGKSSKKKSKAQKLNIKVPSDFSLAQLNCIFLDDRQNVIHTQLEKVDADNLGNGKYQIKLTLDIEVDS